MFFTDRFDFRSLRKIQVVEVLMMEDARPGLAIRCRMSGKTWVPKGYDMITEDHYELSLRLSEAWVYPKITFSIGKTRRMTSGILFLGTKPEC